MRLLYSCVAASRLLLLLGIVSSGAVPSCVRPVTVGQTQVGQGKLYQSGNIAYDRFFQDTHALQVQAIGAAEQEAAARAPLEKALRADASTPEKLSELTLARAKKASQDGPPLYVTVTGLDAKDKKVAVALSVSDPASVPEGHRAFVQALGESAKAEAEVVDKYDAVPATAAKLSARASELSTSVEHDFTTGSRRREVSQELGAAKLILDATAERAREVSGRARSLLKALAEGMKAPAKPAEATVPVPEKTPPGKSPKSRKGSKPAKAEASSNGAPKAVPPASKPRKPADDFNP